METLQPMYNVLRRHVKQHISLTNEEFAHSASFFVPKKLKKGTFLLEAGEICRHLTFVAKGFLRSYTIDAKGEEHIVQFAFEGWWISDLYSYLTSQVSTYYIDALEDSDLLLIEAGSYDRLCSTIPKYERYFRILLQNNYIASHRRILAAISLTAEEQYRQLLETCPSIEQRVAQRHIASYLGITPEALSRIRHRISRKKS